MALPLYSDISRPALARLLTTLLKGVSRSVGVQPQQQTLVTQIQWGCEGQEVKNGKQDRAPNLTRGHLTLTSSHKFENMFGGGGIFFPGGSRSKG